MPSSPERLLRYPAHARPDAEGPHHSIPGFPVLVGRGSRHEVGRRNERVLDPDYLAQRSGKHGKRMQAIEVHVGQHLLGGMPASNTAR